MDVLKFSRGRGPYPVAWRAVGLLLGMSLGACTADAPSSTAVFPADGHAASAGADLGRGEVLSYACRACHGLTPGDESPIGPSLAGIFGRPAAALAGFEYSPALRDSALVWTPEALDAWLAQPNDFLPGNNMAFSGFRSADDRRDLIAYLLRQTAVEAVSAEE